MLNTLPALHLYGFWRTSATYRVRVALAMKGLSAHEHIVNLDAGEQHGAAYRALNPLGGIPTLVEEGQPPITQSLAILEFLEETQPEPPLLPAERHARARVRSLACMLAADTHPLITPRVRKYLSTQGRFDDADWRAWQTHWFGTGLRAVEQRLANESATGRFCHGDTPTLADICLTSVMVVMKVFQIEVGDLPTIERIVARCQALEPFARARPDRQPGAPAPAG
jgi:maleylacetoacetate isomerase